MLPYIVILDIIQLSEVRINKSREMIECSFFTYAYIYLLIVATEVIKLENLIKIFTVSILSFCLPHVRIHTLLHFLPFSHSFILPFSHTFILQLIQSYLSCVALTLVAFRNYNNCEWWLSKNAANVWVYI